MRHPAPRPPFTTRLLFAIPILGGMLREVSEQREGAFTWFVFSLVGCVVAATLAFGLAGLVVGMLFMTTVMFLIIMTIAKG